MFPVSAVFASCTVPIYKDRQDPGALKDNRAFKEIQAIRG
jgi:hypothetical protein